MKGKPHNSGYDDIYNLTQIGYGGSKPQNISHLNRKGNLTYCHLSPVFI